MKRACPSTPMSGERLREALVAITWHRRAARLQLARLMAKPLPRVVVWSDKRDFTSDWEARVPAEVTSAGTSMSEESTRESGRATD